MGEVPYRDVVEGAKLLMRMPLEKQMRMIELILGSAPANVEELVKHMTEEFGLEDLDDVKELMAFILALVKGISSKKPEDVIKGLRHLGFTEANAKALVEKILEELPSAEKDAELLRELGPDELGLLAETWANFFTGDYDSLEEWSEEVGLPVRYLVAAARFLESALKSILMGEVSLRKLGRALIEDYGFGPEQASKVVGALRGNLDELSRVMLFKYLRRVLEAVE